MELVSFSDLVLSKPCNAGDEGAKHTAQAGSIFPRRADALESLEIAKDNVKAVRANLSLEMRQLGYIPNVTTASPDGKIKLTEGALKDYVDGHPRLAEARLERALREKEYDDIKGLVTAYIAKKDLITIMLSDQKNEFYS